MWIPALAPAALTWICLGLGSLQDEELPKGADPKGEPARPVAAQAELPPVSPPGALPPDTAPEIAELWRRFQAAQRAPGTADLGPEGAFSPLRGFDVEFDLRRRQNQQSNDLRARVLYHAGRQWVRFSPVNMPEAGRSARGFWMRDGEEVVWTAGREYAQDRADVEHALRLCQAFTRLADPSRLRLARLSLAERAPAPPPPRGRVRDRDVHWLELWTPDFPLLSDAPAPLRPQPPTLQRVRMAVDRETLTPRLVHVESLQPAEPGAPRLELVYTLEDVRPLSGLRVPHRVDVYERFGETARAPGLPERPSSEVYLLRGALDVELPPERFEP